MMRVSSPAMDDSINRSNSAVCTFCGILGLTAAALPAATLNMVADNDFAVYAGTSTTITRVIYQNYVVWNDQISGLPQDIDLSLLTGESHIYILAMGGGAKESISGTIDGVNLVDWYLSNTGTILIEQSSDISSYLAGHNQANVTNGTYTPTSGDVQDGLDAVTWTTNLTVVQGNGTNYSPINQNPYAFSNSPEVVDMFGGPVHVGFDFPSNEAVLFRFSAVPEPSSVLMLGMALMGLAGYRRR